MLYTVVSETIMENIHLDLSEHEMDVMLNALEIAIENADEYEAGEYEEVPVSYTHLRAHET